MGNISEDHTKVAHWPIPGFNCQDFLKKSNDLLLHGRHILYILVKAIELFIGLHKGAPHTREISTGRTFQGRKARGSD